MTATVGSLYDAYYQRHVKVKLKRPENIRYFWSAYRRQWGDYPVDSLNSAVVQEWFDTVALKSKSSAVRALAVLSSMINWGRRRGLVALTSNPCSAVEKVKLKSRRRFLRPDELEAFKKSLAREHQDWQDFFWLCLLTGARRGNVQSMEWSEVDLALAVWTIPPEKHKNDEEHLVALTDPALAICVRRRMRSSADAQYVFPSRSKTGHLVEVKRAWRRIVKRAGIQDLRPHDLRRTLGSYLAIGGESAYMIGQVLGHIDPRSTAVYARLYLEPTRKAMAKAQAQLF